MEFCKDEQWKPLNIDGLEESYEVSNCGKIKAKEREVLVIRRGKSHIRKRNEKMLNLRLHKRSGLMFTTIRKLMQDRSAVEVTIYIHKVVAELFVPRVDGKNYVYHIDRNKLNNHADNLAWNDLSEVNIRASKEHPHRNDGIRDYIKKRKENSK